MSLSRIVALAGRFGWMSRIKFLLLAVLVGVSMLVFVVVTELARVSEVGLDDAITEDIGETGTYTIMLSSAFGLRPSELSALMAEALAPYATATPLMVEDLPAITPDCPPYEDLGPQPILVLADLDGGALPLAFGEGLPPDSEVCFGGQEIPSEAVYLPSQSEQAVWGLGLVVAATYRDLVAMSTTGPIRYRFAVVTDVLLDQRQRISSTVTEHLGDTALSHGVDVEDAVLVQRVDRGERIRTASQGVRVVYDLIGWGVLVLGGLGLLVSELIVVRDRKWFFGLCRALGARGHQIAGLIVADIVLVLAAGLILALGTALAVQPLAASFALDAFNVEVELLHGSGLTRLVAGTALVLVLAGIYPAIVAVRQDPLEVLEPRV